MQNNQLTIILQSGAINISWLARDLGQLPTYLHNKIKRSQGKKLSESDIENVKRAIMSLAGLEWQSVDTNPPDTSRFVLTIDEVDNMQIYYFTANKAKNMKGWLWMDLPEKPVEFKEEK